MIVRREGSLERLIGLSHTKPSCANRSEPSPYSGPPLLRSAHPYLLRRSPSPADSTGPAERRKTGGLLRVQTTMKPLGLAANTKCPFLAIKVSRDLLQSPQSSLVLISTSLRLPLHQPPLLVHLLSSTPFSTRPLLHTCALPTSPYRPFPLSTIHSSPLSSPATILWTPWSSRPLPRSHPP